MSSLPSPRKHPSQERSRQTVDAILEATARILATHGYSGTNTNLVAARAGVSVGSLYQYFPNKDSLVTALHERHAAQMSEVVAHAIEAARPRSLRGRIEAIVHGLTAAHRLEPALHKVLEKEFPVFDAPWGQSPADNIIFTSIRRLLDTHRGEIRPRNLDLATWTVLQIMESLVHAAVIDPPAGLAIEAIEQAIVEAVVGYLGLSRRRRSLRAA